MEQINILQDSVELKTSDAISCNYLSTTVTYIAKKAGVCFTQIGAFKDVPNGQELVILNLPKGFKSQFDVRMDVTSPTTSNTSMRVTILRNEIICYKYSGSATGIINIQFPLF